MSEDTKDPIQMKKDILSSHIPFIQKMLEKVKNTEFEKKWQQMYDCIMSDKKKLNFDQISKMNKTILGLKCKMQQIDPKKEHIQLKTEQIESPTVEEIQYPIASVFIKSEIPISNERITTNIMPTQISLDNPPLSNEDITQLLVETSAKPLHVKQNPVQTDNAVVSGKSNFNEAETMESIEGFMQHIHGQDSITKENDIAPSSSKHDSSKAHRSRENSKDVLSKSPTRTSTKSTITKVKSSTILLPSPSFENAISTIPSKPYKIPKLSKSKDSSNVITPVPSTPEKLKKIEVQSKFKRRISSSSTNSSKSEEPLKKKLKPRKRNVILDSESSGEDSKVVKVPVKSKTVIVKEKETEYLDKSVKKTVKSVDNKKKDSESLKNIVEKLPASPPIEVPETSEHLIISLENLVGKNGIKKMKSIFANPTDAVNKSPASTNVEKTAKRTNPNLENKSVKKQKLIEQICNDAAVVKKEIKSGFKKTKTELDRLNEDINNMFIRDGVLGATGKRACTLKTNEETTLKNYEKMTQLKKCSVLLDRLDLNLEDKPFKIYNFPSLKVEPITFIVDSLKTVKAPAKAAPKKGKLKKKAKTTKRMSPWTRLASKKLEIKEENEEWEDVEDDLDDSKTPSPIVPMEQSVENNTESNEHVASVDKVPTEEAQPETIEQPIEVPTSTLAEVPTSTLAEAPTSTLAEVPTINVNKAVDLNTKKRFIIPFKKVLNLSYAVLNCGTVYKCTCGDCKFQTLIKPAFIGHLNENHMQLPWNGYCGVCSKTVVFETDKLKRLHIIDEFVHMFKVHIEHKQTAKLFQNAGNSKDSIGFVNSPTFMPKITVGNSRNYVNKTKTIGGSIVGKIIPMVKVPMNFIMTSKIDNITSVTKENIVEKSPIQQQQPVATKVVPLKNSTVIKAPVPSTLWTQTVLNAPVQVIPSAPPTVMHVKPANMAYVIYDNNPNQMLRPWLPSRLATKSRSICNEMLSEVCLAATYKCMASTCSYFTNDGSCFRSHLKAHLQFQPEDKNEFNKCSYCTFVGVDFDSLIVHNNTAHKYDRFQCSYCFYRTVVDFNVMTHMDLYHKMKPKMIIECYLKQPKNYSIELETIKKTRANFVPPIVCVFCKLKFYVFKAFITHINTHTEICNTKCIKCNETTNKLSLHKHLVNCHGFGLFQCVYCKYGTNTFEIINHHLTNLHPNKLPMFCERSQAINSENIPESSIDSTCLKHINQVVNSNLIKKLSYPEVILKNYGNVGKLAKNLIVQKIPKIQAFAEVCNESNALFEALENDPKLLSHQEESKVALSCYDASSEPSTSQKPGECKLQIQRVYSLFNNAHFN